MSEMFSVTQLSIFHVNGNAAETTVFESAQIGSLDNGHFDIIKIFHKRQQ